MELRQVGSRPLLIQRDLLKAWTLRTVRARYQQSLLGGLWAIIQPLATVLIFAVIFTLFVPIDTGDVPYVLFAYVAIVPWTLLSTALPDMTNSLVDNMSLVTKIYFPREVLPAAALLARLLDFAISAVLVIVLMVVFHAPFFLLGWLFLPVILAIQLALVLGLGLACAALNVFVRDTRSVVTLGLQVWFYASPIIYPVTAVPLRLRPWYYLNPMAGVIEGYRDVLVYGRLPGVYLIPAALIAIAACALGYWLFKRVEHQFADVV